ncbi:hypothetical protein PTKIN_Ptkin09bG0271200 [Pterospermum kingtungense]
MEPNWLWLVVLLSVFSLETGWSDGCWEEERLALLQLKSFFNLLPEEEGSDCCQWEWVECNITTGRVTTLFLDNTLWSFEPSGKFLNASQFLPFEELRSLYLDSNYLDGCVDNEGFGKLSKLSRFEILDLSGNYFNASTLSSLSKISTLKSLSLRGIQLNSTDDFEWLPRLSFLETLDFSANYLGGTVQIQGDGRQLRLMNLEELDLSSNNLNNSILANLSGFPNLKSLNLRYNKLNGSIDVIAFCGLSNLENLDIGYNKVNQLVASKGMGLN